MVFTHEPKATLSSLLRLVIGKTGRHVIGGKGMDHIGGGRRWESSFGLLTDMWQAQLTGLVPTRGG